MPSNKVSVSALRRLAPSKFLPSLGSLPLGILYKSLISARKQLLILYIKPSLLKLLCSYCLNWTLTNPEWVLAVTTGDRLAKAGFWNWFAELLGSGSAGFIAGGNATPAIRSRYWLLALKLSELPPLVGYLTKCRPKRVPWEPRGRWTGLFWAVRTTCADSLLSALYTPERK